MQKGHCINDAKRRLRDHISWWSVFPNTLPEQICRFPHRAITVGKSTWQYSNWCFCMHKKLLICFYKNLPPRGIHHTVHLYITECFKFLLWFFCICSVYLKWPVDIFFLCLGMYEVISNILDASDAVKRQTGSKWFMQDNGLTQLFSYRFLSILGGSIATWTIRDVWTWTICLIFQRQTFLYTKVR